MKDPITLFHENMKLAYSCENKFNQNCIPKQDMQQHAMLGLWKACKTYDDTRGFNFSTYATACIKNEMQMAVRSYTKKYKMVNVESLDESIVSSEDGVDLSLLDIIADPLDIEDELFKSEIWCNVKGLLQELTEREQLLIRMYFFDGWTQKEISSYLKLTQSSISRIIGKALNKIRGKYIAKFGGLHEHSFGLYGLQDKCSKQ